MVPSTYSVTIVIPAITIARGIVRAGSLTERAIMDAVSTPPKANAIVDQNRTSFSASSGMEAGSAKLVALPNRAAPIRPSVIRMSAGIQTPTAPAFCTHFPMRRPATFGRTAMARPAIAAVMK